MASPSKSLTSRPTLFTPPTSGSIESLSLAAIHDPNREKWQRVMRFSLWFLFVVSSVSIPANMVMIHPEQRSDSRCKVWLLLALQYSGHCLLMFSRCRAIANFWTPRTSQTILAALGTIVALQLFGAAVSKVGDNGVCFIHPVSSLAITVIFLWGYLCYRFLQLLRTRRNVLVNMIALTGTTSAVLYATGAIVVVGNVSSDPGRLSIVIVTVDAALTSTMTLYMLYRVYVRQPMLRWMTQRSIKSRVCSREAKYRVGGETQRCDRSHRVRRRHMTSTERQRQQEDSMAAAGLTVAHKIQPQ